MFPGEDFQSTQDSIALQRSTRDPHAILGPSERQIYKSRFVRKIYSSRWYKVTTKVNIYSTELKRSLV